MNTDWMRKVYDPETIELELNKTEVQWIGRDGKIHKKILPLQDFTLLTNLVREGEAVETYLPVLKAQDI